MPWCWTAQKQPDGQEVAVWDVDKYRVGHHKGSSNPGNGGNIVLAGHSGGKAYPFNDIYYLKPGDLIELYSNDQVYQYSVTEHILVDEVGQPLEKRLENARYIEPTDEELLTMVACWPLTGPDKFKQRIIIRSKPLGEPPAADQTNHESSSWTVR
jgi:sortase A